MVHGVQRLQCVFSIYLSTPTIQCMLLHRASVVTAQSGSVRPSVRTHQRGSTSEKCLHAISRVDAKRNWVDAAEMHGDLLQSNSDTTSR